MGEFADDAVDESLDAELFRLERRLGLNDDYPLPEDDDGGSGY